VDVVVWLLDGESRKERVWLTERTVWLKDRLHAAEDSDDTTFARATAEKWSRGAPPSCAAQLRYQGQEVPPDDTWGALGVEVVVEKINGDMLLTLLCFWCVSFAP
jgi:hypothetical protein